MGGKKGTSRERRAEFWLLRLFDSDMELSGFTPFKFGLYRETGRLEYRDTIN